MRRILVFAWFVAAAAALYLFFFHREAIQDHLESATGASMFIGGSIYLLLGCIRGFTLIPSTSLVLLAIAFFPATPLFVVTLAGILVSSTCIYYFAEVLHVDEVLRRRNARQFERLRSLLVRYELPVIIGWSFFPLAPTDLVVYLCGVMRVSLAKCLLGVAIGEGTISALYIFGGDQLLRLLQLKG